MENPELPSQGGLNLPTMERRLACRKRPPGFPLMHMRWEKLLFSHWDMDPADIQSTLPKGLYVDIHARKAWLGIVPFFMRGVRPVGLPPLPWLSNFMELNVRTYVFDGDGNPGVWFYSLSCNQPLAVETARRFFHLNYVHAHMRSEVGNCWVDYASTREGRTARYKYQTSGPYGPAQTGSLEFFLLERYLLFSADRKGRLYAGRIHHAPYQWAPTQATVTSFIPALDDGFPATSHPPASLITTADVSMMAWAIHKLPLKIQA